MTETDYYDSEYDSSVGRRNIPLCLFITYSLLKQSAELNSTFGEGNYMLAPTGNLSNFCVAQSFRGSGTAENMNTICINTMNTVVFFWWFLVVLKTR